MFLKVRFPGIAFITDLPQLRDINKFMLQIFPTLLLLTSLFCYQIVFLNISNLVNRVECTHLFQFFKDKSDVLTDPFSTALFGCV